MKLGFFRIIKRFRNLCVCLAKQAVGLGRWLGCINRRPVFVVGNFNREFEGNAWEFASCASRDCRINLYAVALDPREVKRLRSAGIKAALRGSFAEQVVIALADAVFTVGHLQSDFTWTPRPEALRVMLWHATPMKAVGKLNKPVPDPIGFYDIVTATSEFTSDSMRQFFASEGTQLAITGHPKTDPLFRPLPKRDVLGGLLVSESARIIAYLPTWRHDFSTEIGGDFGKNASPLLSAMRQIMNSSVFAKMLEEEDAIFIIKPHLWDDLAKLRALRDITSGRVVFVNPEECDTARLLRCADIVVTDYSGILTDWLILGKPTVCFTYDYQEYWANRGNPCIDYHATFQELMVYNCEELVARLQNFLRDPSCKHAEILRLSNLLHKQRDDQASRRVVDATLELLRERRPVFCQ